ncbi:PadR family transcriptional regulator [Agromyces protaetiae]|uniref:PadR family transcriptional regulator n=1 Tax=Agromyces protaetiae TaxID=2509455 RepID=A0A4P6FBQ5_9MICO|nr:PadR family transcriptional regulator [Agromyces protaetiae]QAY73056.1 PadR family transcriptional regulator [Agromyces protaetiae]
MPRRRPGVLLPLEAGILDAGMRLQTTGGSFYGFGVARALADAAGDGSGSGDTGRTALTAHGTLYKALGRMADQGLLESSWEAPEIAEGEGRPRRRLYRVTAEGATVLAAHRAIEAERAALLPIAAKIKPVGA